MSNKKPSIKQQGLTDKQFIEKYDVGKINFTDAIKKLIKSKPDKKGKIAK